MDVKLMMMMIIDDQSNEITRNNLFILTQLDRLQRPVDRLSIFGRLRTNPDQRTSVTVAIQIYSVGSHLNGIFQPATEDMVDDCWQPPDGLRPCPTIHHHKE